MVDLLRSPGRADESGFRGHPDVSGDLEVVLLLTDEGLVGAGVKEPLVGVNVVGGVRPGEVRRSWWIRSKPLPPCFSLVLHSQSLETAVEQRGPLVHLVMVPRQMLV